MNVCREREQPPPQPPPHDSRRWTERGGAVRNGGGGSKVGGRGRVAEAMDEDQTAPTTSAG